MFIKKIQKQFIITETNHIIIDCKINNIDGRFLIDTGASNSCVDYLSANKFKLNYHESNEKASSASNYITKIFYSKNNILEISHFKKNNFDIILFNMIHINNSLEEKNIEKVHGIIGGDILLEHEGHINYQKKILTLKF